MKVETENLLTIKNYSDKWKITPSYTYKLIKNSLLSAVVIDGVQFIDMTKHPSDPKKR